METTIKYLTSEEKRAFYEKIEQDTSRHAIRNRAIFYLAEYCALRVSEVGALNIADYDSGNRSIYCKREKKSNNNTIRLLNQRVYNALESWLAERKTIFPESNTLFVSQKGLPLSRSMLDYLIKSYCQNTIVRKDHRHFHVLKHTRAVELGDSGADVSEIQWWLGHVSILNTQIYMQFTTHQQNSLYKKLENEEK